MLFNSLQFLLFFIIVTLLHFSIPQNYRWLLLLAASCFFYMAFVPVYIFILGGTIAVDYFAGIFLEESNGSKRKFFLIASLIANIGVLAAFKYYNFLNEQLTHLLGILNRPNPLPVLKILLPIGLSFHTFQAMSYTIEVYRGNQKAEKHFGIYALYVMFYPQLVAGPIERPQNLLHQFHEKHEFDFERFKNGFTQMAFGFFKKVVIADRLAMAVDYAFGNISSQSGLSLLVATFFYSFQIYCDFSGYSDIAIGAARIMGFDLMENFRSPYFSSSIAEFWRRWHISLSSWFRDYLYIPLGGNRVNTLRLFFNLFIVFLLSGLWHGANMTFICWGILHGVLLIVTILARSVLSKSGYKLPETRLFSFVFTSFTFLLVTLAWVFFRATSLNDAFAVYHKFTMITFHDRVSLYYYRYELIFCLLLIAGLLLKEKYFYKIQLKGNLRFFAFNGLLLFACYFFGIFNLKQFIYFQF